MGLILTVDVSDISLTPTSVKNSMGPNLSPNGSIICILFAKSYAEIISLVQVLVSVLSQICLILNASKMVVLTVLTNEAQPPRHLQLLCAEKTILQHRSGQK